MNLAIAIGAIALAFVILLLLPRHERQDREELPPKESSDWAWPPR